MELNYEIMQENLKNNNCSEVKDHDYLLPSDESNNNCIVEQKPCESCGYCVKY